MECEYKSTSKSTTFLNNIILTHFSIIFMFLNKNAQYFNKIVHF